MKGPVDRHSSVGCFTSRNGFLQLCNPPALPSCSDARPIPDHQEVWADPDEDQSLVVEVVERAGDVGDEDVGR
jgi:hypothetical protein